MGKTRRAAPLKKTPGKIIIAVGIVSALAAVIVVPPTFRSCQIAEQSLKKSHVTHEDVRPQPLSLRPEEIFDDVRSRPPLQQPDVVKSYLGNRVDWLLDFASASATGNEREGRVIVLLRTSNSLPLSLPFVVCEVKLLDYPWLKVLDQGSEVRVRGTIRDVDLMIKLDDVELELKQEAGY